MIYILHSHIASYQIMGWGGAVLCGLKEKNIQELVLHFKIVKKDHIVPGLFLAVRVSN